MQMNARQNYSSILKAYDRMGGDGGMSAWGGNAMAGGAGCSIPCCDVPQGNVGRLVVTGFERVCIAPCSEETVRLSVAAPMTVVALYVPGSIAGCLSLKNWSIGRWQAFGNCDPVPAEVFSCCELDENQLLSIPVAANTEICITVVNECKRAIDFRGAIKGIVCDPC